MWIHGETELYSEQFDAEARERLVAGNNAYRVSSLDPKARLAPHKVLGAVLEEDRGVGWVELAVLDFEDSRGLATRVGHGALRCGADVLATTAYLVAIGGGVWLTVALVDP